MEEGVFDPVSYVTPTICLGKGDVAKLGAARITLEPSSVCKPHQKGATLVGPAAAYAYVCRSCACNAHNAICNRHGVKPLPVTRDFNDILVSVDFEEVEREYDYQIHHYRTEWIMKWPAVKRAAIYLSEIWDDFRPKQVKCMVKREVGVDYPKKARAIQFYPNLYTQARYGPEFTALQKAYTNYFQRRRVGNCRITIASGMDARALGNWMDEVMETYGSQAVFYERDGKNWDASMGPKHFDLRMEYYRFMPKDFRDFVVDCSCVTGSYWDTNTRMKYKMEYTVKSGHNDTTLGNNLVNLSITYASCKDYECDILVAGDDLLVVGLGLDGKVISCSEEAMGIKPEWAVFNDPCDVSFISGVFARGPLGYKFVPRPGRLLTKLFWTVNPPSWRQIQAYQRGICLGLLPTCGDMPVVGPWLKQFDQGQATFENKSILSKRMVFGNHVDVGDLRPWFCERYGLTSDQIDEVEAFLLSAGTRPVVLKHPLIDRIIEVDMCELSDRPTVGSLEGLTTLRRPVKAENVSTDSKPPLLE